MKLTFLGTGTSFGVPVVGCDCDVCTSDDPRDRRTRHGALLELPEGRLLIDTPPELRLQLLRSGVDQVGALWLTHLHADHTHGIDDVRVFTARSRKDLPAFTGADTAQAIERRFDYIFDPGVVPPKGTSKPRLRLHRVAPFEPLEILGAEVTPLPVPHGAVTVLGLRVGPVGYLTDAKAIPDATLAALEGVRVLVLNALWSGDPHPTHFNVEEAVEAAERVGAERTYLTHITHRIRHAEVDAGLPEGVSLAFDGMEVEV